MRLSLARPITVDGLTFAPGEVTVKKPWLVERLLELGAQPVEATAPSEPEPVAEPDPTAPPASVFSTRDLPSAKPKAGKAKA